MNCKMFVSNGFPDDLEDLYLSGDCHCLSKSLLKYYSRGEIYLLISIGVSRGNCLLHSYYFNQGIWSDITGSYTDLREMISFWSQIYNMDPGSLAIIPLLNNPEIDMYHFRDCKNEVSPEIIQRIDTVRKTF